MRPLCVTIVADFGICSGQRSSRQRHGRQVAASKLASSCYFIQKGLDLGFKLAGRRKNGLCGGGDVSGRTPCVGDMAIRSANRCGNLFSIAGDQRKAVRYLERRRGLLFNGTGYVLGREVDFTEPDRTAFDGRNRASRRPLNIVDLLRNPPGRRRSLVRQRFHLGCNDGKTLSGLASTRCFYGCDARRLV